VGVRRIGQAHECRGKSGFDFSVTGKRQKISVMKQKDKTISGHDYGKKNEINRIEKDRGLRYIEIEWRGRENKNRGPAKKKRRRGKNEESGTHDVGKRGGGSRVNLSQALGARKEGVGG